MHTKYTINTEKELLKVSKFQNEFMKSSFLPKYERKIVRISALQGRRGVFRILILWVLSVNKIFI